MKEYPVSGDELLSLGLLQSGSALFFAVAGACFGFYISTKQAVDLAGRDTSQAAIGWWSGLGAGALWGAGACAIIGFALFGISGAKVWKIKKDTYHS